jgi:DNA-binding NarL/FixJ family response regulator
MATEGATDIAVRPDSIAVLHVDDDQSVLDLTATFLEREDDRLDVVTANSVADALDALAEQSIDCVVSDYDMPDRNGLAFLDAVREDHPDLPFILFTGKGSEEIASEAISRGVTDYLQKETGTDQYTVLANRIRTAVSERRATRASNRLERLHDATRDLMNAETPAEIARVTTRTADEVLGLPLTAVHLRDDAGLAPVAATDDVIDVVGDPPVIEPGDAAAWDAYETGEVRAYDDIRDAEDVLNPETPVRSEAHLPLGDHGIMIVASTEPGAFGDADLPLAELLASNAEAALDRARRERALERLHEATRAFIDDDDAGSVASTAVDAARDALGLPIAGVWFADGDRLDPVAATEETVSLVGDLPSFDRGDTATWRAFETGETLVYGSPADAPGDYDDPAVRSQMSFPLGDRGVLNIGSPEEHAFDDVDVSLGRVLAANTEAALRRLTGD